jgi:hypothetical protein
MLDIGDLDFYLLRPRCGLTEKAGQSYVNQRQQDADPQDRLIIHDATPPLNSKNTT